MLIDVNWKEKTNLLASRFLQSIHTFLQRHRIDLPVSGAIDAHRHKIVEDHARHFGHKACGPEYSLLPTSIRMQRMKSITQKVA